MNERINELLRTGPKVVNVGVADFAVSMRAQGLSVVQVDWRPPAGGDPEMIALLDRLL
jgi:hypothetical protein